MMPEILTESFCERCGTRYTFESGAPAKTKKLGRFKTISKGLKNYVLSDDTSLDEAMAAARSDDEHEQTAHQLDAFHSTFNFCMNCRQYTCSNCWNEVEGRCLTCAPHLGREILPAPFPDLPAAAAGPAPGAWPEMDIPPVAAVAAANAADEAFAEVDAADRLDRLSATDDAVPTWLAAAEAEALAAAEAQAAVEAVSEPYMPIEAAAPVIVGETIDAVAEPLPERVEDVPVEPVAAEPVAAAEPAVAVEAIAAAAALAAVTEPDVEPEPAAAQVAAEEPATPVEPEPIAAAELLVAADAQTPAEAPAVAPDDRAAAAMLATSALLAKFRPGQSIDAELDAYEAAMAAESAAAEPEPVAPVEEPAPDRDVGAIAAAAALAASPEPEPEPVAASAEPEPIAAEAAPDHDVAAIAAAARLAAAARSEPEPEPERIAAAAEPEPIAAAAEPMPALAEPEPIAAAAESAPEPVRTDVVPQPTWQIVAPDTAAPATNGHVPDELPAAATAVPAAPPTNGAPSPAAPPQWPAAPEWPQPNVSILAQRSTSPSAAMEALWVASARDVVAPTQGGPVGGVQPCNSCGLSLSANARFCRRCGTRQG
jgi:nicotinate-nucleotide--dimethylbenzimidazole phosphoribosyltransferase